MFATGLRTCMPDMLAAFVEDFDDLRFEDGERARAFLPALSLISCGDGIHAG